MTVYVVTPTYGGVSHEPSVLTDKEDAHNYAWRLCYDNRANEQEDQVEVHACIPEIDAADGGPSAECTWADLADYHVIMPLADGANGEDSAAGRRVLYTPSGRLRGPRPSRNQTQEPLEYGVITSWDDEHVFVRYSTQPEDAPGKATSPFDLNFIDDFEGPEVLALYPTDTEGETDA
jgi:hypothetical protein